jgi:hypothetical protein
VYLPIRIGQPPAGQETVYELVLVPGNELKEVSITLSSVDAGPSDCAGVGFEVIERVNVSTSREAGTGRVAQASSSRRTHRQVAAPS